jgi:nicotinamidase-related amidase
LTNHVNQWASVALILVDVVNHFEFPEGDRLLKQALPVVPVLARLKRRARRSGIPVIYVNDNFGQWRSDAAKILAYCLRADCTGRDFVAPLQPEAEDYCVLKPMHSAFYQTPLDVLLRHLGISSIILAGIATNSCVLCTAHDANMRDYDVIVVEDCCAARTAKEHDQAIEHIRSMADARIMTAGSVRFDQIRRAAHGRASSKGRGDGR